MNLSIIDNNEYITRKKHFSSKKPDNNNKK